MFPHTIFLFPKKRDFWSTLILISGKAFKKATKGGKGDKAFKNRILIKIIMMDNLFSS